MDRFEIPLREYGGAARESRQGAGLQWEFQCGDIASHSSQLQLGVRRPVLDTDSNPDLPLVLKRHDCTLACPSSVFWVKGGSLPEAGRDVL